MSISVSEVIGKQLLVDGALSHGRFLTRTPELENPELDRVYFVLSRKDMEPERGNSNILILDPEYTNATPTQLIC